MDSSKSHSLIRRRSASESGPDRQSAMINLNSPEIDVFLNNPSPKPATSIPNFEDPEYFESPSWTSIGTRLQVRKTTTTALSKQQQIIEGVDDLRIRVEDWKIFVDQEDFTLDSIMSQFSILKSVSSKLAQDAIYRRCDKYISDDILALSLEIKRIRNAAERYLRANERHIDSPILSEHSESSSTPIRNIDNSIKRSKLYPSNDYHPLNNTIHAVIESELQGGPRQMAPEPPDTANPTISDPGVIPQTDPYISKTIPITNPCSSSESYEIDLSLSLSEIINKLGNLNENPSVGFSAVSISTDAWRNGMSQQYQVLTEKLDRLESLVSTLNNSITGSESSFKSLNDRVDRIASSLTENISNISSCNANLRTIASTIESFKETVSSRLDLLESNANKVNTNPVNHIIDVEASNSSLSGLGKKIRGLEKRVETEGLTVENLTEMVVGLKEQLDSSSLATVSRSIAPQDRSVGGDKLNLLKERDVVRKGLERSEHLISQLISTEIPTNYPDVALIRKCNTVDMPALQSATRNCEKALLKYFSYPDIDSVYCDKISALLDRAEIWSLRMVQAYTDSDVHSISSNSKGDTVDVGVFSDNSEKSVFEFFESVELAYMGWGNNRQKASKLYNKHLSPDLKIKLINLSDNYIAMRDWLIDTYGGAERIVNDILASLSRKSKPVASDRSQRYSHLSVILAALHRLERLAISGHINSSRFESALYSRTSLTCLTNLLPQPDYDKYIEEMIRLSLDWRNPVGEPTFQCFKTVITMLHSTLEAGKDKVEASPISSTPKPKSKGIFASSIESDSEEEPSQSSFVVSSVKDKEWFKKGLKYPCPLYSHEHEMSNCRDFFALKPNERWYKLQKRRICYTCLAPKSTCKSIHCENLPKIPEVLICAGCAPIAAVRGRAPFNILLCRRKDHAPLRAKPTEIRSALDSYLGKLDSSILDANIIFSVNFSYQVFLSSKCTSRPDCPCCLKPKPPSNATPTIHSQHGSRVPTHESFIIPESQEHTCYLLQYVRIGNSNALIFFDRGANAHLIDGALADRENLELISSKPTALTVIGGNKINTQYGSYRFNMGPGEEGQFHELSCVGIDTVTSSFPRYDLSEIHSEYRSCTPEDQYSILPPFAGGSQVHLLLGIKNTNLDPILIKTLPSGIGVYLSPFLDIWGSRIIFGGPHKSFTTANNFSKTDFSHAIFLIRESAELTALNTSSLSSLKHFSYPVVKELSLTVHPYPINEEDLEQVGGQIPEQFEDMIDSGAFADLQEREFQIQSCRGCNIMTPVDSIPHIMRDTIESPLDLGSFVSSQERESQVQSCMIHKAKVPIARIREVLDIDDNDNLVSYRCSKCSSCPDCKKSWRMTAISLQESREQDIIERSVSLDLKKARITVQLPFVRDPVPFLVQKHRDSSNYYQALKVYKSQCSKPETVKEKVRLSHQELLDKGFMCKLADLPPPLQAVINEAPFLHYYPWRSVVKAGSLSTPVRLVVDPTMSSLNVILAKGEAKLGSIFDIIIRSRSKLFTWASDISKLYNQLWLDTKSLPYSLFLFHPSLSNSVKPDIYVMTRAWYGVVPTGNQAGHAITHLAALFESTYPTASNTLTRDIYVDDISSGANSDSDREEQIKGVINILGAGGFSLKYIVKSGEKPPPNASEDDCSVKLLGYVWKSESDTMHPGFNELNFNKKVQGSKLPNVTPIANLQDALELLSNTSLTRRMIVSVLAELYDPCGFWEPWKLQLKLLSRSLSGLGWDEILPAKTQDEWKIPLSNLVDYPKLSISRCCFPMNIDTNAKSRLICLTDAAEHAGGAVVYAGRETSPGTWTCSMVASKSKILHGTIPRNELSALLLGVELTYMVVKSFGFKFHEILYLTDSTITMCWIHNEAKKLRVFVFSRVETIRRMIEWTIGPGKIPVYHIEGSENIADLLTKPHSLGVSDLSIGSKWQSGTDWMKRDFLDMPLLTYTSISVPKEISTIVNQECYRDDFMEKSEMSIFSTLAGIFDPPTVFSLAAGRVRVPLLVDPISLGWYKSLSIISIVREFTSKLSHLSNHTRSHLSCFDHNLVSKISPPLSDLEYVFFRYESQVLELSLTPQQLSRYEKRDDIYYFRSRFAENSIFEQEDLDGIRFLDTHVITGSVPVVLVDSPILYSYLMMIHLKKNPHSGVELTLKQVFNKMFVPERLRSLIKKIISNCSKCRLLAKKTSELRMANHPTPRTILAPPFFNAMVDIAYNFPAKTHKKSRVSIKVYALVIVCLMSGATNILSLEGLELQDVVQGLERHASRHGIPSALYIDNGTQLRALEHAKFTIRDIDAQISKSMGMRIFESNPKAHAERGRVERKIRAIRDSLSRLSLAAQGPRTALQWETLFSRIVNTLDDLPIATGNSSNSSALGFEIITANRLKLGRNNFRSLEGSGITIDSNPSLAKLLERNREIYSCWYQFFISNIHQLMMIPNKWLKTGRLPTVDDIVLFIFTDSNFSKQSIVWKLGRVIQATERKIKISYASRSSKIGSVTMLSVDRNPRDVSLIYAANEFLLNTPEHYAQCAKKI